MDVSSAATAAAGVQLWRPVRAGHVQPNASATTAVPANLPSSPATTSVPSLLPTLRSTAHPGHGTASVLATAALLSIRQLSRIDLLHSSLPSSSATRPLSLRPLFRLAAQHPSLNAVSRPLRQFRRLDEPPSPASPDGIVLECRREQQRLPHALRRRRCRQPRWIRHHPYPRQRPLNRLA